MMIGQSSLTQGSAELVRSAPLVSKSRHAKRLASTTLCSAHSIWLDGPFFPL